MGLPYSHRCNRMVAPQPRNREIQVVETPPSRGSARRGTANFSNTRDLRIGLDSRLALLICRTERNIGNAQRTLSRILNPRQHLAVASSMRSGARHKKFPGGSGDFSANASVLRLARRSHADPAGCFRCDFHRARWASGLTSPAMQHQRNLWA